MADCPHFSVRVHFNEYENEYRTISSITAISGHGIFFAILRNRAMCSLILPVLIKSYMKQNEMPISLGENVYRKSMHQI